MTNKISNTKVGIVSPITAYANGKEAQDIAPQYLKVFPANVIGSESNISTSLDDDYISPEANIEVETQTQTTDETKAEEVVLKNAPLLSDIELVSNTISYDATGTPSVTVVFKVKNSSGQPIKAVNARVQV